ncbi:MAG: hypothetical protein RIC87_07800 [Kiloniellales bacterium]
MIEVAQRGGAEGDVAVGTGTENNNRPTGNDTLVERADVDSLCVGDGDDTLEDGSDELTATDLVWL